MARRFFYQLNFESRLNPTLCFWNFFAQLDYRNIEKAMRSNFLFFSFFLKVCRQIFIIFLLFHALHVLLWAHNLLYLQFQLLLRCLKSARLLLNFCFLKSKFQVLRLCFLLFLYIVNIMSACD